MAFYANLGYHFKLPNEATHTELVTSGSIILACALPMHQLLRRKFDHRYPHMRRRLFDPQLYLAGIDANQSSKHCAKLASYPWFGVIGLEDYISSQQQQSQWLAAAEEKISELWPQVIPTEPAIIRAAIQDCLDFQARIGCQALIAPSPLTFDNNTNYETELYWLDTALELKETQKISLPIYATVAIADICVRYADPLSNPLLELILDAVSAREIDGVYIVLEQGGEPGETRHCSNTRALRSILHLVHIFTHDCGLRVAVNFLGQFGLACEAAGAELWASAWYKSVYRLRIADALAGGRAFPKYWSHPAVLDIHLNQDYDNLNRAGIITSIADRTDASIGLIMATLSGKKVNDVQAWRYGPANVKAAQEHFMRSCIEAEEAHSSYQSNKERLDFVENWLGRAAQHAKEIERILGANRQTRTEHVQSWYDAFRYYRADHNV
ncbi:MAG: hypothetical protein KF770_23700 [Anaerolineae bacterium]|nr:hypothetical protein [Anaerolineae bacterium]